MKKFWFVSLCALLVIAASFGWNIPIRVAIGANAVVILLDIVKCVGEICHGNKEEKNEDIDSSKKPI